VFSGGDGAFPPALLITAAAQGKVAARSIDVYLRGERPRTPTLRVVVEQLPTDTYRMTPGCETLARKIPIVPLDRRSAITEVEQPFTTAEAQAQARRCLYCHTHPIYDGDLCVLCGRCADICPEHCIRFAPLEALDVDPGPRAALAARSGEGPITVFLYDGDRCIRCGLCAVRCPTAAITMERFHFDESTSDA
jgi:ferredoxin